VNGAGNAVLRVDNYTNVPFDTKRNSVRITTTASYNYGSIWIIDLLHIPYGCSVWPAFWSFGANWPLGGEIDIIEGVNLMTSNQMSLHTLPGCVTQPSFSTGTLTSADCSTASGCAILDTRPTSFGAGFAQNGGGVWATQYDVAGIFIWFFPRDEVPSTIFDTPLDISSWGVPTASYPNTENCPVVEFFTPQQLVLDITLCGVWAGIPPVYNPTCGNSGPTGLCYNDNVVGSGANYDNAYFEVSYVKTYTTAPAVAATPTGSTVAEGFGASSSSAGRASSCDAFLYLVLGIGGAIVIELL